MTREHGTKARYVFGPEGSDRAGACRCEACRAANRQWASERNRLAAYGRWLPYVDAGPAREHLRMLAVNGIGWKRAAALSGVPNGSVSKILYGGPGGRPPAKRVRPETEAAILAVRPVLDVLADTAAVDATGTKRRIRALVARGWSQSRIAARLGMAPKNLGRLLYRRERVSAATARAVIALYAELQDQAPPEGTHREKIAASRARRYAAERGWAPPAAWDRIDDPDAAPAEGWQRAGRLTGADLADEGRDLMALGMSRADAAKRLGVSTLSLGQVMGRNPERAPEAGAA